MKKIKYYAVKVFYICIGLIGLIVTAPLVLIALVIGLLVNTICRVCARAPKRLKRCVWLIAQLLYSPLYMAGSLLHFISRLLLAVSYAVLLEWNKAADIFKSLLRYGKH